MTLTITTASRNGITVVADHAVTRRDLSTGSAEILPTAAQKTWYHETANVSLAAWGSIYAPKGIVYEDWLATFAQRELRRVQTPGRIANLLAQQLKEFLQPCRPMPWRDLRRGIHVAGFEQRLPVIYHVHMGTPELSSWPQAFRDFPDIHGGGGAKYRSFIDGGGRAQLRNGYHELYSSIASVAVQLKVSLEAEYDVIIPAPTLRGQVALDRALVRFVAGLLESAEVVQAVSEDVTAIAFGPDGPIDLAQLPKPSKLLRPRAALTAPPTSSAV